MTGVLWGDDYVAEHHANEALRSTRRAGPAVAHPDDTALLRRVADALVDLQYKTWDFGDSVAFEAMIAASERLGDERWARFAQGYGRAWASRSKPFVRLDCTVPGRALVLLAARYHDRQLLEVLHELADYLLGRPTLDGVFETWERSPLLETYSDVPLTEHERALLADPPAGVFVDCLHFDPPFLVALGRALHDDRYVSIGVEQALGYVRMLQTESGLFDHFVLRGEPGSFGPGWGRGQGWAILGLLEVIEDLGDDPAYANAVGTLRESAARLLEAMVALQRPDGHWYAVVDDDTSGEEFSTAGFMAWAIASARELGVVGASEDGGAWFERAQSAARRAVLESLDADAQLREVSAAVYASTEPEHYAHVPRGYVVPWGQGPALLALLARDPGTEQA